MKILALCDNFYSALRFYDPELKIKIAIFNNQKRSKLVFILINIFYAIKSNLFLSIKLLIKKDIILFFQDCNHKQSTGYIKKEGFDIGLHAAGVIYRRDCIEAFNLGILNSHIGLLPYYRGRSVFEWTILNGGDACITCFFIDTGIDTGEKIVLTKSFSYNALKEQSSSQDLHQAKEFLFQQDVQIYKKSLKKIEQSMEFGFNDIDKGKRYYIMSNLFLNVAKNQFSQ